MNVYIKPTYIILALFFIVVIGALSQQKAEKKVITTDEEVSSATTPLPSSSSEFQYPNSTIIFQSGNSLTLESNNDPNTITNWYKEKIRAMGMNATAFSQTSVNGNISNKLAGAGSGRKIDVSITKSVNQSKTTIQLTL